MATETAYEHIFDVIAYLVKARDAMSKESELYKEILKAIIIAEQVKNQLNIQYNNRISIMPCKIFSRNNIFPVEYDYINMIIRKIMAAPSDAPK